MAKKIDERKSTKAEIFEAYQEQLKKANELEKETLDPQKEIKQKKEKQVIKDAESIKTDKLNAIILSLQKGIENANEEMEAYSSIAQAIKVKESELKELFGIEKEANTLAGLVNAKNETERLMKERKLELEKEYSALKSQADKEYKDNLKKMQDELKLLKKLEEEKRERELDEYNYTFNRNKNRDIEELEDRINKLKKQHDEDVFAKDKEIREREQAIIEREQKAHELEKAYFELQDELKTAKDTAFEEGKAKAKKNFEYEVRAIKQANDSQVAILDNNIKHYHNIIEKLEQENDALRINVNTAMEKIESMARASMNTSQMEKAYQDIKKMAQNVETKK